MERRQFLAGTVPTMSVVLGGCLGSGPSCTDGDSWPPEVEVEALELAPGDSGEFDIQVDGITLFSFDRIPGHCASSGWPIRFGDIETTPRMDAQADSCPPIYTWDDCTRVTVTVPVFVASDAEPGTYEFGFGIAEQIGESNSLDDEFTITVTGN